MRSNTRWIFGQRWSSSSSP